ncbi:DUF5825 family protein [Saccharopolyspora sp. TS4A08]|uniref:DUF5825 family protein n=1 Tax=Saccharopolyspora ipomoeae TaxID=3042027 RepID=A0ABT6PJN0_9PSEU|nr:DUF5825 family protein [Saccharopolyspora sp. TS4A08]MDI2028183.1 DUF5825 family protein [Saccharopolyspora sp. TS4A08]
MIKGYLHHRGRPGVEPVLIQPISAAAPEQARSLVTRGIRRVVVAEPVWLADDTARHTLDLLRELAAWAVRVEWTVVEVPPGWRSFAHLPPPTGTSAEVEEWGRTFHPGKCVLRQGPGFVQIRDRRSGVLDCYTIDEPYLREVVHKLASGVDPDECDPAAVALLVENGLLVETGRLTWWAPARLRRWPVPAMAV